MGNASDQRIEELLGVLDVSLLEFEELLGELSEQSDKLTPRIDTVSREQRETRAEIAELREMIEGLGQRLERLTTLVADLNRDRK
jgi:chaperonin cofactor prefoldin